MVGSVEEAEKCGFEGQVGYGEGAMTLRNEVAGDVTQGSAGCGVTDDGLPNRAVAHLRMRLVPPNEQVPVCRHAAATASRTARPTQNNPRHEQGSKRRGQEAREREAE